MNVILLALLIRSLNLIQTTFLTFQSPLPSVWVVTGGLNLAETKPVKCSVHDKAFPYLALQSSLRIISDDIKLIRTESIEEVNDD